MRNIIVFILALAFTTPAWADMPPPPETPATVEEYAAVLRLLIEHHYKDTSAEPPDEYYSPEMLGRLARATFTALQDQGIGMDHPKRTMWVATVTANLMSQSRLRFDATSGWNYWDPDGDGVKERVKCSWGRFDSKCDYGAFQMNAGATLRMMWQRTFKERFKRRFFKTLRDPEVMMPLAVMFLRSQHDGAGFFAARSCTKILRRKRALRKAGCYPFLRKLRHIAKHLLDRYDTERKIKHISRSRRCHRCERACGCEVMRRATGGKPGKLTTGLATVMGGTLSAWWVWMYYQTLDAYRNNEEPPDTPPEEPSP